MIFFDIPYDVVLKESQKNLNILYNDLHKKSNKNSRNSRKLVISIV